MRIAQINGVNYGSTGSIMFSLADRLTQQGHETLCTAGFTWRKTPRQDYFVTSNIFEKTAHTYLARLTGKTGAYSSLATRKLLKRLDGFSPDVIHLHNVHGWFVNIPMLFSYIKKHNIPVVWTLHDCWAFTGQCPHFESIGCQRWQTGCGGCDAHRYYPKTLFDCSATMYERKKQWFSGVENLTIVTPSQWLKEQVGSSFLRQYPVEIIHNGVDLSVFRPGAGDFRKKNSLEDKKLVLGVSYGWDDKKGLDVFLQLAERLDESYCIVLVGIDEAQEKRLPKNILPIRRTQDRQELAGIYSAADVFVNPTREDTFPTVNMEALACGTPVVTFRTGGSPEILDDSCGVVVKKNDIDAMEKQIRRICSQKPYDTAACRCRAQNCFDKETSLSKYIDLYRSLV